MLSAGPGSMEPLIHAKAGGAKGQIVPNPFVQKANLVASGGAANDVLGVSIALDGDTMVVGAPGATVGGNNSQGAAYVFTKSGAAWTQTAKLIAADGAAGDDFGSSVSISGNTLVVGANLATVGGNNSQGAAYVFTESGAAWTQTAKLTTSGGASYDEFGTSVSVSGNTVVVGAVQASNFAPPSPGGKGAAYVFTEPASGWTSMTQTAKLTASSGAVGDYFGGAVSISGNTVAVGAANAAVGAKSQQGMAYVFVEPASGWASTTQTAELTASDGVGYDNFGNSLSISGNTVVVGAQAGGLGPGAAYVYTEASGGWANMTQTAELTASDGVQNDEFGSSVSISGNTVVVGACNAPYNATTSAPGPGAAYVFVEPNGGWASMTQTAKFTASDGAANNRFGVAVAMSGGTVAVGSPTATVGSNHFQGEAYVFGIPTDSLGVYSGGYWYFHVNGTTQIVASPAAWASATPVVGDWNGDGKTEIGLFNNGSWWLDTNEDGTLDSGDAQFTFGFGGSDVVPVVGDWNGAGKTEVGVYANGAWFRDVDGTHAWDATNQAAVAYLGWNDNGTHTVIPVPGNWAGDGKTEMGVYCQGVWFLDSTDSGKWDGGYTYWGWSGSLIPVVGNWSGSGLTSQFGVYSQGVWFLDYDNTHSWDAANQAVLTYFGWAGAQPVVGYFQYQ